MATKERKVSFYRLNLEKQTIVSNNAVEVTHLTTQEIENCFAEIYNNKMRKISNGNNVIDIEVSKNDYVLEVIDYNSHSAFIKIGQQNAANTVALRNQTTLETEAVPMSENQMLELFTYCLIDFETGIVSYIGINGAPKISVIRSLFDKFLYKERNIRAELAVILTKDVLEMLAHKEIISMLEIKVAVPSDRILSDAVGISRDDFCSLENMKTCTATYKMAAPRSKNIFGRANKIAELIASVKQTHGDNLLGITANAKDSGEKSQCYDLLSYSFTKSVTLDFGDNNIITEDDFKVALRNTYNMSKDELLVYCRT